MIEEVPLRVDFAGGWLDVPAYCRAGGFVVNCAITPFVSLKNWPYRVNSGLGGSAAWSILSGKDPYHFDAQNGCGWQDPAIILETGLCVWKSGKTPCLHYKNNGHMLEGKMAIYDTQIPHNNKQVSKKPRDYNKIYQASQVAAHAVENNNYLELARAVNLSYTVQLDEGMSKLPPVNGAIAYKYCGGGHGGYALYLFRTQFERDFVIKGNPKFQAIEPYCK
jgi:hypothetical protein